MAFLSISDWRLIMALPVKMSLLASALKNLYWLFVMRSFMSFRSFWREALADSRLNLYCSCKLFDLWASNNSL